MNAIQTKHYGTVYPTQQEALYSKDNYSRLMKLIAMVTEHSYEELMGMTAVVVF